MFVSPTVVFMWKFTLNSTYLNNFFIGLRVFTCNIMYLGYISDFNYNVYIYVKQITNDKVLK